MGGDTQTASKARKKREKKLRTENRKVEDQTSEKKKDGVEGPAAEGAVQAVKAAGSSASCLNAQAASAEASGPKGNEPSGSYDWGVGGAEAFDAGGMDHGRKRSSFPDLINEINTYITGEVSFKLSFCSGTHQMLC